MLAGDLDLGALLAFTGVAAGFLVTVNRAMGGRVGSDVALEP